MNKLYIDVPTPHKLAGINKVLYYCKGVFLSPVYWILSHRFAMPGLRFYSNCVYLGFFLLFKRKLSLSYLSIYKLLFFPMDSTRYFEFDFVWKAINVPGIKDYLDVSSPRILPLLFLHRHIEVKAQMINPDKNDLAATATFIRSLGLTNRCNLHSLLISEVPFEHASFDVISCVSVLEHIPEIDSAIRKMWDLLRPGGKLIITLPCMAEATEQYISENEYGLLPPGSDGYTFWQMYFDQSLLEQRIYTVTGKPSRISVYGEKKAGSFAKNAYLKRSDGAYPFWREPYMMGEEYAFFNSVNDLPGEGVVAMEFVK